MFDDVVVGTGDAEPFGESLRGAERIDTRHAWVWIRHCGAWRKGALHCWYRTRDGTLIAWMQHEDPDPHIPWTLWGAYRYDPATIRPRHPATARASVEVTSRWGPRQLTVGTLERAGYHVDVYIQPGADTSRLAIK